MRVSKQVQSLIVTWFESTTKGPECLYFLHSQVDLEVLRFHACF